MLEIVKNDQDAQACRRGPVCLGAAFLKGEDGICLFRTNKTRVALGSKDGYQKLHSWSYCIRVFLSNGADLKG